MAQIAGQVEAAAQAVDVARQDSNLNLQVVIEVRSQ
jgi:hypothetical protein